MSLRTLSASALVTILPLTTLTGVASAASFSDVPSTHVNAEAIAYVKAEGIVSGYPNGTFKPNQTINRAEFTKIIILSTHPDIAIENCIFDKEKTGFPFSDISNDAWYRQYACAAYTEGILKGYPDGTFRGGTNINFAEAATILANGYMLPLFGSTVWYEGNVRSLAAENAIPTSIIRFDQLITRGEMAEMVYRLKAGITNKQSTTYQNLDIATYQAINIAPIPIPTEAVQMPRVMDPTDTYIKMNTELDKVKTYADLEAFTLKYGSKAHIEAFRSKFDAASEAKREQEAVAVSKSSLSEKISFFQESVEGNTATLIVSTKPFPDFVIILVFENNQWKLEDMSSRP